MVRVYNCKAQLGKAFIYLHSFVVNLTINNSIGTCIFLLNIYVGQRHDLENAGRDQGKLPTEASKLIYNAFI